jgi:Lar family restriction alleviation protein
MATIEIPHNEPCPFCGGPFAYYEAIWDARGAVIVAYAMRCEQCGAYGPESPTASEAHLRWNQRHKEAPCLPRG